MSHGIAISKDSLDAILGELRRRDEMNANRYQVVLDRIMPFIPLLLSMGGKTKETEDPVVGRFLGTLGAEQIAKICEILNADQVVELMGIAQRYAMGGDAKPEESK